MVFLQIATPYLIHRLLNWLEKEMRHNTTLHISPHGREFALTLINGIRNTLTFLHRCHLAAFYMSGVFYHIAKRFTNIHYVGQLQYIVNAVFKMFFAL
jgi:peroxin-10